MSRKQVFLRLGLCILLFLGLQRVYIGFRNSNEVLLNDTLNGRPSAWVINTLTPEYRVSARDGKLHGHSTEGVDIKKGCEGFEVALLLLSVLAVYPMRPGGKLAGMMLGALLIYLVNIVRIVSLYYLRVHRPDIFALFHATFWQAAIVVMAWLFFMFWIGRYGALTAPAKAIPE